MFVNFTISINSFIFVILYSINLLLQYYPFIKLLKVEKLVDPHKTSSVDECRLIDLKVIPDPNGKLAVTQNGSSLPFDIQRVFYLYDVPAGAVRGGHSHFKSEQVLMVATGSYRVIVNDGVDTRSFILNNPSKALYIPAGIWRELDNFASGTVSIVLASDSFNEEEYVRRLEDFIELTETKRNNNK